MKTYVIHYTPLKNRKEYILKEFYKHSLVNFEFIEEFDKQVLTENDKKIFNPDLNEGQKSIISKHLEAYRRIAEGSDAFGLIVEDDVLLADNFINRFQKYVDQLINTDYDWDMCFISDCCNLHIQATHQKPGINIYRKSLGHTFWGGHGASRGTDAYLVSKKCATTILNYVQKITYKINQPSDHWLNTVARDNNLRVYWGEPTLTTQMDFGRTY